MKLLLAENRVEYFPTHRRPLALAARRAGFEVHVTTMTTGCPGAVIADGFRYHDVSRLTSGSRFRQELSALLGLRRLLRELRPEVCHLITLRAVFHGLLAIALGAPKPPRVVCSITGLGFLFTDDGLKARVGRALAGNLIGLLRRSVRAVFIFQNRDDRSLFAERGWVPVEQSHLICGSGVDVNLFRRAPLPDGVPIVLFCARYLLHKGIFEFIEAARLLKAEGVDARFVLTGDVDPHNPASASRSEVDHWISDRLVEDWGRCGDMPARYAAASIVVLPSWREGLPKVVIEAAATGRPVVTTDVPGCRESIVDGASGLLVPVRDPRALADAIGSLLRDRPRLVTMADAARKDAERRFSADVISAAILGTYAVKCHDRQSAEPVGFRAQVAAGNAEPQ